MDKKSLRLVNTYVENERLKCLNERTIYGKRRDIDRFLNFVKKLALTVSEWDIQKFIDHERSRNLSETTMNQIISHLKDFYAFLLEDEYIFADPTVLIELPKQERNHNPVFTESEIKRIFEATRGHKMEIRDRSLMELLYSTGMRCAELTGLDIDDVNFTDREITIRHGKFGKERIVPVGEEALSYLDRYLDQRLSKVVIKDNQALFLSLKGSRIKGNDIRTMIRKYKRITGITKKGLSHAFRYACATHILKHGGPIQLIQRLLGHEYLCTTQIYTEVTEQDLKEKYNEAMR